MHDKFIKIQSAIKVPKNQRNNFGNYNYRSAEDIMEVGKPLANAEGLSLCTDEDVIDVGGRVYVKSTAILSDGEKEMTATGFAREAETQKGMSDSQLTGATASYAKKYALGNLFGLDDTKDADATNKHGKEEQTVNRAMDTVKEVQAITPEDIPFSKERKL